MKRWSAIMLLALALLLLAGCQAAEPQKAAPDGAANPPAGGEGADTVDYPAPQAAPVEGSYPAPAGQQSAEQPSSLWLAYPPAPGDDALQRGNFMVESASLETVENEPGSYNLKVEGSLPTPCNAPRVTVNPPDQQNRIVVEVYSLADPQVACTQVIQPFSGVLAKLSGYPSGAYTVMVNEVEAGQITVP